MKIRVKLANGQSETLNLKQPVTGFDYPDGASFWKAKDENGTEYNYNFDKEGYYTGRTGIVESSLTPGGSHGTDTGQTAKNT